MYNSIPVDWIIPLVDAGYLFFLFPLNLKFVNTKSKPLCTLDPSEIQHFWQTCQSPKKKKKSCLAGVYY